MVYASRRRPKRDTEAVFRGLHLVPEATKVTIAAPDVNKPRDEK